MTRQESMKLEIVRQQTTCDFTLNRNTLETLGFTLDGLQVQSVDPGTEAARVSLPVGHFIISVNSTSVVSYVRRNPRWLGRA